MVEVNFSNDIVSIKLPNREILMRYEEFHSLSEIYMQFYIKESIEAYLKRNEREDLANHMDAIVEKMYCDIKYMLDDSETIAAAVLDATGEAI